MHSIRKAVWGDKDPYGDTPEIEPYLHTWDHGNAMLLECAVNSQTICEVGVWYGYSCLEMANQNTDAHILAVDTWRGGSATWGGDDWIMNRSHSLYDQFRSNVLQSGMSESVTPFPIDSLSAQEVCEREKLEFDLVHIDGGHGFMACYSDLINWSRIAGTMIVDDYEDSFPGVQKAVDQFLNDQPIGIRQSKTVCKSKIAWNMRT